MYRLTLACPRGGKVAIYVIVVKVGCWGTNKNITNVEVYHGDSKAKQHANNNLSLNKAEMHLFHVTF